MNDMDPVHVAGNAVQTTLTYFDGQQRSVLASTTEVPYPEGKLIVSRTDTRGIITQCNQAPDANANSWTGLPPHLERIS